MHNRDHVFYQYALLNLAALHADFGAYAEAIVAIRESISAAREQNDQSCLNYSLSWLYHFGKVHTAESEKLEANIVTGTDKDALNFLKVKSKETNMWSVFSTSILGEARLGLAIVSVLSFLSSLALWSSNTKSLRRVIIHLVSLRI